MQTLIYPLQRADQTCSKKLFHRNSFTSSSKIQLPNASKRYMRPFKLYTRCKVQVRSVSQVDASSFVMENQTNEYLKEWDRPCIIPWYQWILCASAAYFVSIITAEILSNFPLTILLRITIMSAFLFSFSCFFQSSVDKVYEKRKKPTQLIADPDSLFWMVDDVAIHYKCKRPIQQPQIKLSYGIHCFHGFGEYLTCWGDVQSDIAATCNACVTAADMIGFGLTQRPLTTRSYRTSFARKVGREILNHELNFYSNNRSKEIPQILIGHSLGGQLAMEETIRNPKQLAAVILVNPDINVPTKLPTPKKGILILSNLYSLVFNFAIPLLLQSVVRFLFWILSPLLILAVNALLQHKRFWSFYVSYAYSNRDRQSFLVNKIRVPILIQGAESGVLRFCAAKVSETLSPRRLLDILLNKPYKDMITRFVETVTENNIAVLIIHGENDKMVPIQNSENLTNLLPNARLLKYPNCGHCPQEEYDTKFCSDVTKFINALPNSIL